MFYRWSEALHGIGYFGGVHFGGQVCMYILIYLYHSLTVFGLLPTWSYFYQIGTISLEN